MKELHDRGVLSSGQFSTAEVSAYYDTFAEGTNRVGQYMNFGLWFDRTVTHREACDNLMNDLIGNIRSREGRVLDAACGFGATTQYLTRYWRPTDIVGINLTAAQIGVCVRTAPACRFFAMDATALDFDAESFNNIICVEAAQHFCTREKFLREALRILKPGGMLVMSDLLLFEEAFAMGNLFPAENYLPSPEAYYALLVDVGFSKVDLVDITESGWCSYARFVVKSAHERWFAGATSFAHLQRTLSYIYAGIAKFSHNLIVRAQK